VNEPNTLNELLDLAVQKQGTDSGRELARRAQSQKFEIVHTTINGIRNGSYKSAPSDDTIRALGWLAGVGEEAAFTAAGRRLPGPPFADELPPGVDDLSPKEREAVIGLLRVLIAQRQEIQGYDEEQESRTQEGSPEHSGTGGGARRPGAPMNAGQARTNADRPNRANPTRSKAEALIDEDQGSQADHELAARKGETQREFELRTLAQPEDQSQDDEERDG
jgi:hypothetical protein